MMQRGQDSGPSGWLLRIGAGLMAIALGLDWLSQVLRRSWPWLVGSLLVGLGVYLGLSWWRSRGQW